MAYFVEENPAEQALGYECPQCSKNFTRRFNLKNHIESVHSNVDIKCPSCSQSFTRKDNCEKQTRQTW